MYEKFQLSIRENQNQILAGYHWPAKDPKYVVCIVHGIGEYAGRYDRVAQCFKKSGIATLSMDLRGHGESFGRRGHCAPRNEVSKDVDALICHAEKVYPDTGIIIYGHSMGGNIALDYKKRGNLNHVPAGYIISAPWVELVRPVSKPLYAIVKTLSKIAPAVGINSDVSAEQLGHPRSVGDYKADPLVHSKISTLCIIDGFETGRFMAEGKLEDNGRAKNKPMLLMHGSEDKICDVNGSRKIAAIETCEYVEWPGLYHEIHNGGQQNTGDEVIEEMVRWILAL